MDKIKGRIYTIGVSLLISVTLAACGGGGGNGSSPEARAPTVQNAGGDPPNTGGDSAQSGNDPPSTGDDSAQSGNDPPSTGDDSAQSGDAPPSTGDDPPNTGDDDPPNTGDDPPNTGGGGANSGDDPPNTDGGGANSGDDERNTDDGSSTNSAPSISGSPTLSVVQNSVYEFVPSATDPDGDPLTFNTLNKPPDWTSFNSVTGALTGTPTEANIGRTKGISIGVTDGMAITFLPSFRITVDAIGPTSATLSWTIPNLNEDGTPLMDLAGFRIHYGTKTGKYTEPPIIVDNPGVSALVIENLSFGSTYFFVVTAFDESGNESEFSNEASKIL